MLSKTKMNLEQALCSGETQQAICVSCLTLLGYEASSNYC